MKSGILLLVFLFSLAAVPLVCASGDYMGSNIVLGGSGPNTVKITEVATAATPVAVATVPPAALSSAGSLSVTTSPAGALIVIDGIQQGVSPATIPGLSAGSHTILLKLDGYQDLLATVTITAGQTQAYTTGLSPSATPRPAVPVATKSPGFEAALGIAALGAALVAKQRSF